MQRLIAMLAIVLCTGCGSGTHTVTGAVTYEDGAPARELAGGVITFDDGKQSAVGTIDAEGRFALGTNGIADGVLAGSYRVAITQADPVGNGDSPPLVIDARFSRFETSGLQADVQPGRNEFTFKVAPPALP
jgi:hypothetical protein